MRDLGLLHDLFPIVRAQAAEELAARWIARYREPRPLEPSARIWFDHYASVAEYWEHKRRHPNRNAGALVVFFQWTPYILAAASVLTVNPIILLPSVLARRRPRGVSAF